jgi:NTE family protein
MTSPRIGLALSGGGFRATAFGLGCLRALHDRDLLKHVSVVSGISGGSILTAMWAYGPQDFSTFDDTVVELLRKGLQGELIKRALAPSAAFHSTISAVKAINPAKPRRHSRTDALIEALQAREFGNKLMHEVTHSSLRTVISATDMTSRNAVRFGSEKSACSAHGRIITPVTVAEAAAASAAYPLLLPTINRRYDFERLDGSRHAQEVVMTDGGVYENLGLAPLLPGRSALHSPHIYELDYIVAADAGRGRNSQRAARFLPRRLAQSFDITYGKTQDASRSRIHEAGQSGQLQGFIHAYLGMRDERIPMPLHDLVPRKSVQDYPTNFAPMKAEDLTAIAVRGEQLTRTLISCYCPDLGS